MKAATVASAVINTMLIAPITAVIANTRPAVTRSVCAATVESGLLVSVENVSLIFDHTSIDPSVKYRMPTAITHTKNMTIDTIRLIFSTVHGSTRLSCNEASRGGRRVALARRAFSDPGRAGGAAGEPGRFEPDAGAPAGAPTCGPTCCGLASGAPLPPAPPPGAPGEPPGTSPGAGEGTGAGAGTGGAACEPTGELPLVRAGPGAGWPEVTRSPRANRWGSARDPTDPHRPRGRRLRSGRPPPGCRRRTGSSGVLPWSGVWPCGPPWPGCG